jgi:Putative transmembrane protein (PGPGW)
MVFRVLWIAGAALLVLAGLAMTVLPGPATVVIPTGLVMLGAASKTMRGWLRRWARGLRTTVSARDGRKSDSRGPAGLPGWPVTEESERDCARSRPVLGRARLPHQTGPLPKISRTGPRGRNRGGKGRAWR